MSSLIWLASYPKSGNTWVRTLFSHYMHASDGALDMTSLTGQPISDKRDSFDEILGVQSSDLTFEEIQQLRPLFHRLLAADMPATTLMKTHQAFQYTKQQEPFFAAASTQSAIYVIRNPLDVVVSYASFIGYSFDRIIDLIGKQDAVVDRVSDTISQTLPYLLGDWASHVQNWQNQTLVPVKVVRYEDLHSNGMAVFREMLEFCGFDICEGRLQTTVRACSFDKLQRTEAQTGVSPIVSASGQFFRKGQSGEGQYSLSKVQRARIENMFGEEMQKHGYL